MSKKSKQPTYEFDDEFYAQLDFLRNDYDRVLEELEQAKKAVRKLMALLVENDIPVPQEMLSKYIRQTTDEDEELPFD